MKIRSLEFQKYNQFENLTLDLTYPEGHPKAGQPLDKVCLIGQNGTGKTTILEEIGSSIYPIIGYILDDEYQKLQKKIGLEYKDEDKTLTIFYDDNHFCYKKNPLLLSLKADILSNVQFLIKEKKEKGFIGVEQKTQSNTDFEKLEIIEINNETESKTWDKFFTEFNDFDDKVLEKTKAMLNAATSKNGEKLLQDFVKWKATQVNPRENLSKQLNIFLQRFGLEMNMDNTDFYITLRSLKEGLELLPNILSTGILQIILSSMPIFALRNKVSIILIDEPERSLYPDTQRDIIEYYTKLSPESQFFFATHSPVIAASFDPWEVVELYFDENHQVRQRLYYHGERHVDNYKIHPKYMRWDSLLIQLFGIDKEGNPARETELQRLFEIKDEMDALNANGGKGSPEMLALWQKYQKAAENLDWRTDNYKNGTAA